jgi:inner membrane protein
MTLPNHIAGGFVFTGVFGGIAGINILESPGLIIMTIAGATIADMDLPQSLWGRIFGPLSRAINRRFGHRTITHSLLFMAGLWLFVKIACGIFETEAPYPTIFLLSFFSHLLFDMMTLQGVPIFYPYRKNPCVIPADPNMRFNGNNRRSELAIFGFFIAAGLFMQPLMSDGFWTTYNKMFGTIQHLRSEFEKSNDLLLATYRYREASSEYEDSGYVIEASGDFAVLWNEADGWKYLDGTAKSLKTILDVIPEHTGKEFHINRKSFVAITKDSLEAILNGSLVYQAHISGNKPFAASYEAEDRTEQTTTSDLQLNRVEYLHLTELATAPTKTRPAKTIRYKSSPRIRTLENNIRKLTRKQAKELETYHGHQGRVTNLEHQLDAETDIYQQTILRREYNKLRSKTLILPDYSDQLTELKTEIYQLTQTDQDNYNDRREAAEAATTTVTTTNTAPLRFTGILTTVDFTQRSPDNR